jgi:Flp pilus assembly protein TadB
MKPEPKELPWAERSWAHATVSSGFIGLVGVPFLLLGGLFVVGMASMSIGAAIAVVVILGGTIWLFRWSDRKRRENAARERD